MQVGDIAVWLGIANSEIGFSQLFEHIRAYYVIPPFSLDSTFGSFSRPWDKRHKDLGDNTSVSE